MGRKGWIFVNISFDGKKCEKMLAKSKLGLKIASCSPLPVDSENQIMCANNKSDKIRDRKIMCFRMLQNC